MDLIAKRDLGFTPSPQLSYKREIEVKHSNFDSRLETHTFEHVESPGVEGWENLKRLFTLAGDDL